ncbi:MAG TPA: sugar ABC transporter ATP-binding protein [Candidatus Atribacteria bacterium]|nr:sugar ABC transporter ATP-binding protein [Candidatus Atribacteria bacterium]
MEENILEVRHLSKNYPGVAALKGIDLDIRRNTVHCIVGENGAGKSTFIKILTCAETRSSGEILFNGKEFKPRSIREAMDLGISTLFQELSVVNQLTVEENLILGREPNRYGVIQRSDPFEKVFQLMKEFAPDISLKKKVAQLSFAEKQVIEIVKAIAVDASLLIMDEPTAAVSENETKRLFAIIRSLKEKNITVIYISHILDDIFTIGDVVTVFRDGEIVGTKNVADIDRDELIRMMIGKVTVDQYIPRTVEYQNKVLEVNNLTTSKLKNVSFKLHKGEILGFYGLRGSGKTEIALALFGLDRVLAGDIQIEGKKVHFDLPRDAMLSGISMVPEERLTEGLIMKLPVRPNISITNLKVLSYFGVIRSQEERKVAENYVKAMNIKVKHIEQKVATLSGGNQQKVVVSKYLHAGSNILMMDEPTRGVDIGAKEEIHRIIRSLAEKGKSIIVFSSEYPEIFNLCDRIYLLREGQIVKEVKNQEANPEEILHIITRGKRINYEYQAE